MFNLYTGANDTAEYKGEFSCEFSETSVPEFAAAMESIKRSEEISGVWINKGSQQFYIERSA